MKFFKTLFLLSISTLAINAWATSSITGSLTTVPNNLTNKNTGAQLFSGLTYDGSTIVIEGETLRALWVFPNEGVDLTGEELSTFYDMDAAGQLILKPEVLDANGNSPIKAAVWATVTGGGDYISANAYGAFGTVTDPSISSLSNYYGSNYFEFSYAGDLLSGGYPYLFFVGFDRRVSNESTVEAGTTRVAKWGATKCGNYDPELVVGGGGIRQYIFDLDVFAGRYCVTYPQPTIATIPITSWTEGAVVYEKNDEVDTLTPYLTPEMGEFTLSTDGLFTLKGNSVDICTYTLQTKASLSDPWVTMDSVIENLSNETKNSLANKMEKCYTCLRVKESTQIKIPKLPEEKQRFYRLIAE